MATDPWLRWAPAYRKHDKEPFVRDGGGPDYHSANPRVLFALKEPHGTHWEDARQQLSSRPIGMWHALGRWAHGILRGFPEYSSIGLRERMCALRQVAVINLKKRGGGRTSVPEVINAFARRDAAILRDQVATLAPHIIVACGADVFGPLLWILDVSVEDPASPLGRPAPVSVERTRWLVPWRHPARGAGVARYKTLRRLVSPILRESN